jgi:hypothetical protein
MSGTIRITLSGLHLEALERVRGYGSNVAQIDVMPTGDTFIVRVTDYGRSLKRTADRAALWAQSDLRQLFRLDKKAANEF